MRYLLASIVLMSLVVGCAQSSSQPTTESTVAVNSHCPIMGGDVTEDGGRAEWNGKTIGFCCPDCEPKWEALSDEEKAEKLAAADGGHADSHDHSDHDHS